MATINLGAIKFNWKGAYNSSTSYAVDDVVSSGGNSYVCIQAHSNQAVGNATAYWNIMSSAGTNGTNGTDLTSTLTTQGDIVYRDGSGLARLGYGTAGQVLKTGGSGANPSWTDQSGGGLQFISKHNLSANTGEWIFDQVFASNSSFNIFEIYYYNFTHTNTSNDDLSFDFRKGASGSESSFRGSHALFYHRDRRHGNEGATEYMQTDASGHQGMRLHHSGVFGGADERGTYGTIRVFNPHKKDGNGNTLSAGRIFAHLTTMGLVNGNNQGSYMYSGETWGSYDDNGLVATGFSLKSSSHNIRASATCQPMVLIFGVKES
jgi:hypothetical protein